MFTPEGMIAAMITPFDRDGELLEGALRQTTRRLLSAGVHGLFCLGTNGEFYALTFDEKVRVAEIVVEEAAGKIPVYAGTGCATTRESAALAARMESVGVQALSVVTPYFLTYTQEELIEHYRRIAEATALPIVLYNIPSRTGNTLQPQTVATLAQIRNIAGMKDSSGSFDLVIRYIEQTPDDFSVLVGTDSLILPGLMAGSKGAIAATANVFPERVASIYESWKRGDIKQAEQCQRMLSALRGAFSLGTQPSVLKAFLNKMGVPAGLPRQPVGPLGSQAEAELERIYRLYVEQGEIMARPEAAQER